VFLYGIWYLILAKEGSLSGTKNQEWIFCVELKWR